MQTYSAEILNKILEKGKELLKKAHPDAVPILQNMIHDLQDRWKELLELQEVEEMLIQLIEWVEGASKTLAAMQAQPIGETLEEVEAQLEEHEVKLSITSLHIVYSHSDYQCSHSIQCMSP